MIAIVNYGMGNLGSIKNMLRKIGCQSEITSDFDKISKAKKIILPGVGAFDTGMKNLQSLNLIELLNNKVLVEKVPVLGICLGVQLMTKRSEEGNLKGLCWFDAETIKFEKNRVAEKLLLPNIGWRYVKQSKDSKLLTNFNDESRFYFVHTYHLKVNDYNDVLIESEYGYEYVAALEKENILGVQFHPEKSHKYGMELLKNFVFNY
jgi:glutamine amidotransferase